MSGPQRQQFRGDGGNVDVLALSLGDDLDDAAVLQTLGLHTGPAPASETSRKRAGGKEKDKKKKKPSTTRRQVSQQHIDINAQPQAIAPSPSPPAPITAPTESLRASRPSSAQLLPPPPPDSLVFVEPIPKVLVCPVCGRLCRDPVIASRCGHTICRCCVVPEDGELPLEACPVDNQPINVDAICPNLALRYQIDDLVIYCPNGLHNGAIDPSGCQERIQNKNLAAHLDSCAFSLVSCTFCQKSGPLRRKDFETHLLSCRSLPCDHAQLGCTYIGTSSSLQAHLKSDCPYEPIKEFAHRVNQQLTDLRAENTALRNLVERLLTRSGHTSSSLSQSKLVASPSSSSSSPASPSLARSPSMSSAGRRESIGPLRSQGSSSTLISSPAAATAAAASSARIFGGPATPSVQVVWKSSFVAHSDTVWSLAVGDGGDILVSSSSDMSIRVWDINSPSDQSKYHLVGHQAIVYAVTLNDRMVYSGDAAGLIKVWGLYSSASCIHEIQAHSNSVCKLLVSPEHGMLFSGSLYEVKVWNLRNYNCITTLAGHRHWVRGMALSGNLLVTGSGGAGNAIAVWDLTSLSLKKHFNPPKGSPSIYSLVITGRFIFAATYANTIDIWDMESAGCVDRLIGHSAAVYGLCLLSENRLASCSYDGTIRIWDLATNRCIQNLIRQKTSLECIVAHPDNLHFFSGASEGTISAYAPVPELGVA